MKLIKGIKKIFNIWIRIKEPPGWVWKVYNKWEKRLLTHPYDMTKYFIGGHYIYRVEHGCIGQGQAPIIGWWKKKNLRGVF